MDLSYCVVNTNGRELLLRCLEAIEETAPAGLKREVLVLDNASDDGSAKAVREKFPAAKLVALRQRTGKSENDSTLLRKALGRYCLLLNEDAELLPGAVEELVAALDADPEAAAAGAQLLWPDGRPQDCAWRFPSVGGTLAFALFMHRRIEVQSQGDGTRRVDWCQSSAMLVRREAAEGIGYLDTDFFVYSDETDFQKRLADAGWHALFVPAARAKHHEQLSSDVKAASRRIVEFHRGRDRYMRKHSGWLAAQLYSIFGFWGYLFRLPKGPARFWLHARQALLPDRGEGLREAAEAYNAALHR